MPLGIVVYRNLEELATAVAAEFAGIVQAGSDRAVALSAGPLSTIVYEYLPDQAPQGFPDTPFVSVCERFRTPGTAAPLQRDLLLDSFFAPLSIDPSHLRSFEPDSESTELECLRMDEWLDAHGPIRLFVAEIDDEGRIGLVQGGTSVRIRSHVAVSAPRGDGRDFLFGRPLPSREGLTLGLQDFTAADHCIALASGGRAGAAIRKALSGLVSEEYPCAAMRFSRSCHLAVDPAAAREIGDDLLRRFPRSPVDDAAADAPPPFFA